MIFSDKVLFYIFWGVFIEKKISTFFFWKKHYLKIQLSSLSHMQFVKLTSGVSIYIYRFSFLVSFLASTITLWGVSCVKKIMELEFLG